MKITLPNGDRHLLNDDATLDERIQIVVALLEEWEYEIYIGWKSNSIRLFLDSLSNYLIWYKGEKENDNNSDVLSKNQTNRLYRGRKDIPFSSLNKRHKNNLFGIIRGARK